jgi:hypothetical protein
VTKEPTNTEPEDGTKAKLTGELLEKTFADLMDELKHDVDGRISFTRELFGPILKWVADLGLQQGMMISRTAFVLSAGSSAACLAYLATNPTATDTLSLGIRDAFGWCLVSVLGMLIANIYQNHLVGSLTGKLVLTMISVMRFDDRDEYRKFKAETIHVTKRLVLASLAGYVPILPLLYAGYVVWDALPVVQ